MVIDQITLNQFVLDQWSLDQSYLTLRAHGPLLHCAPQASVSNFRQFRSQVIGAWFNVDMQNQQARVSVKGSVQGGKVVIRSVG